MSLKEFLLNDSISKPIILKGYPMSFEDSMTLIRHISDYLMNVESYNLMNAYKELILLDHDFGKMSICNEKFFNYKENLKSNIYDINVLLDYIYEELEPSKNYELMGYLYYYISWIDDELIGCDRNIKSIFNFLNANRYDLAQKICKQEIDCLEHDEDNPNYFDNPNYHKLKEFEKLIAEHEQEKNKNTD